MKIPAKLNIGWRERKSRMKIPAKLNKGWRQEKSKINK
jgi:hypothetical protein